MKSKKVKKKSIYENELIAKNKVNLMITSILSIIISGFDILLAFIIMELINIATYGKMGDLLNMLKWCTCLLIGYALIMLITRVFKHRFIQRALKQYKEFIFERLMIRGINIFQTTETSKFISSMSNDVTQIELNYLESYTNIVQLVALLIGGLAAMIFLNISLFVCVIVTAMLPLGISLLFRKKVIYYEKEVSNKNEKFIACLKDILSGFSVIKSFNAEETLINVFNQENRSLEKIKKSRRDFMSDIEICSKIASIILLIAVFSVGTWLVISRKMTAATVVAFIQLLNYIVGPIEKIPPLMSKRKSAKELIYKIEDAIETNEDEQGDIKKLTFDKCIEFKDVSFGYEEGKNVLKDINLKIEKGKSYAIVGISGSGKSTLLNLLMGYSNSYDGQITIDNTNIISICRESLYNLISVIQQNVFIFNSTIDNNVTMYKEFPEKEKAEAIENAGLSQIIKSRGMDYICGENGVKLSGGEKQRISIARSMLRKLPILLMDEATAALDNETAHAIEQTILSAREMTRVIVTHKMDENIMKMYDEIIMMKNGEIVEKGNFEELMKRKNHFYALYSVTGANKYNDISMVSNL